MRSLPKYKKNKWYNRLKFIGEPFICKDCKHWKIECLCKCGNTKIVYFYNVIRGLTTSCGCKQKEIMRKITFKDLTGRVFGMLTVIKYLYMKKGRGSVWLCKCSCSGKLVEVPANSLVMKKTSSCGCFRSSLRGLWGTRIYKIWEGMMDRCYNPNNKDYARYGGRGIAVDEVWHKFLPFYDNTIESYNEHVEQEGLKNTSLDRWPSNDGNYGPKNYRWATPLQQSNNRRNSPKTKNKKLYKWWHTTLQGALERILFHSGKSKYLFYFGCTAEELRSYIESQFEPWMNWSNRGNYRTSGPRVWQLDHIKQVYTFDLAKKSERLKCFNVKNLRPWDAKDNVITKLR